MKRFDTRAYNISDFLEWNTNQQLDLSPDFQRRSVWSEKAKSYLIDTVIRGKPIPKILITQELKSRRNVRVVVDGQQRMRAILGFLEDDFAISRAHNKEFPNRRYSDLPKQVQTDFLNYEIGVDLLYDLPYQDLLDIFARINTYTVKLNAQEKLNAQYLGYFKQVAFELGYRYVEYFLKANVLTKAQISRMAEAQLASDLLVALTDGVQTNKSIETYYKLYEDDAGRLDTISKQFDTSMSYIGEIYDPEELANTNWARVHWFYSLFTVAAHGIVGLKGLDSNLRPSVKSSQLRRWRVRLDEISAKYDQYTEADGDGQTPPKAYADFIDRSRRRTTDTASRVLRANFICKQLANI
jgi:hypothetical protein